MELDRNLLAKETNSLWYENSILEPDDEEDTGQQSDELIRLAPTVPGPFPRRIRPPVRRRLPIDEKTSRGHNAVKSYHIANLGTRQGADRCGASPKGNVTTVTAATSACSTDIRRSLSGLAEEEDEPGIYEDDGGEDMDGDGELLVPKIEPIEEDVDMTGVNGSTASDTPPAHPVSPTSTSPSAKRPRGRPRKHPVVSPDSMVKVSKGRSKTGCITCRKRKKKCDEAKPGCMNCEKNAVTCEGYTKKTIWKSGREKAEEGMAKKGGQLRAEELIASAARSRKESIILKVKLDPVILGVETTGDKMFFEHYIYRLSGILTVEKKENHSFRDMLLQLAVKHAGLMHSILALSSKHIDFRSSYGIKFLQEHPDLDVEMLEERSQFHHDRAMSELTSAVTRQNNDCAADDFSVDPAMYGQMICLVLETLADPRPTGQHRVHLEAYSKLITQYPPEDKDFLCFIEEFFQYHISADELISLPEGRARLGFVSDNWKLPTATVQPDYVRLLGVYDGLFLYMSQITNIRNKIRENTLDGVDPVIDYNVIYRAAAIDTGIRKWTPAWPAGDTRDLAGVLYKQMMRIYLLRTIYSPRTESWKPDSRIVDAVDNGIEILAQFKPNDPTQTLILAPAFVIGCAAFVDRQREPIRAAVRVVKEYTHYKNSDSVLKVLEEVWRLMDAKSTDSWDWQMVAHRMKLDFLAT